MGLNCGDQITTTEMFDHSAAGKIRPHHPDHIDARRGKLLAIALVRHSFNAMQKEFEVLKRGHPQFSAEPFGLTEASHLVAVEFATIAAANNYWR